MESRYTIGLDGTSSNVRRTDLGKFGVARDKVHRAHRRLTNFLLNFSMLCSTSVSLKPIREDNFYHQRKSYRPCVWTERGAVCLPLDAQDHSLLPLAQFLHHIDSIKMSGNNGRKLEGSNRGGEETHIIPAFRFTRNSIQQRSKSFTTLFRTTTDPDT
ncbi:4444_t:CDS:2, partial [Acaulospora colombiana]